MGRGAKKEEGEIGKNEEEKVFGRRKGEKNLKNTWGKEEKGKGRELEELKKENRRIVEESRKKVEEKEERRLVR